MSNRKKILMLLPHLGTGGDWVFVQSLSKILQKKGYKLCLAASNIQGDLSFLYESTVPLKINQGVLGFLCSLTQLSAFDKDISFIHANSTSTLLYAILLRFLRCRKASILFTFHLHLQDSPVRVKLKQLLFTRVDHLHCPSQAMVTHIHTHYHQPKEKIALIPLGVDEACFQKVSCEERAAFREHFDLSPDDFVLLFAGRLNPEKNISVILEFIALKKETYPHLKLLIAGNGPCRSQLEEIIRDQNLQQQVFFVGYRTEMRSIYGACDLLLLPSSRAETFGLVVVEAAFCGLPTLRSDMPGATDQIVDGLNGLVYSNIEPKQFHDKLASAIENPQQIRKMGEVAHDLALQKFTLMAMGDEFERLLV